MKRYYKLAAFCILVCGMLLPILSHSKEPSLSQTVEIKLKKNITEANRLIRLNNSEFKAAGYRRYLRAGFGLFQPDTELTDSLQREAGCKIQHRCQRLQLLERRAFYAGQHNV